MVVQREMLFSCDEIGVIWVECDIYYMNGLSWIFRLGGERGFSNLEND